MLMIHPYNRLFERDKLKTTYSENAIPIMESELRVLTRRVDQCLREQTAEDKLILWTTIRDAKDLRMALGQSRQMSSWRCYEPFRAAHDAHEAQIKRAEEAYVQWPREGA